MDTDVFIMIFAVSIVILFLVLIVKFLLNPLFFPETFPKKEVHNFMEKRRLTLKSYKKVNKNASTLFEKDFKVKNTNFPNSIMISLFLYRKSYFKIVYDNDNVLWLKVLKSNSFFDKSKIVFYLEEETVII